MMNTTRCDLQIGVKPTMRFQIDMDSKALLVAGQETLSYTHLRFGNRRQLKWRAENGKCGLSSPCMC